MTFLVLVGVYKGGGNVFQKTERQGGRRGSGWKPWGTSVYLEKNAEFFLLTNGSHRRVIESDWLIPILVSLERWT